MTAAVANSTTTGTLPANTTLRVLGDSIVTITRDGAFVASQSTARDNFVGPYPVDSSYSVVAGGAAIDISLKDDSGTGEALVPAMLTTDANGNTVLVWPDGTEVPLSSSTTVGPVMIEFGLSLLDRGYFPDYNSGGQEQIRGYRPRNFMAWLKRRLGAPFHILHTAGRSGDTFEDMLARIAADVLNRVPKPDYCLVCAGGNEMRSWDTFALADSGLSEMQTNFESVISQLQSAGITPIVFHLSHNGAFGLLESDGVGHPRDYGQWKFRKYLRDYCRVNSISLLNGDGALERPLRQEVKTASYSRAGTGVVTATVTAHGYSTGDYVVPHNCVDSTFDIEPALATPAPTITVIDPNTYTYTGTSTVVATTTGKAMRMPVWGDLFDDGAIHYNAKGASKIARLLEPQMRRLFPAEQDFLITHSGDFDCLIAPNNLGANYFVYSTGMLDGTTGTLGTNVTGSVASNWTVNVLASNHAAGTVSNHSVVASKVQFTDEISEYDGSTNLSGDWQRMVVSGGSADSIIEFAHNFIRPGVWQSGFNFTLGNSVRPFIENGYFYVCVIDNGSSTTSEPTWPTRVGERVIDGGITWECRQGFTVGTNVYAGAEYRIVSLDKNATSGENEAVQCLSFGIWKSTATKPGNSNDAAAIMDFSVEDVADLTPIPLFEEGEQGVSITPIAPITDVTDTKIGMRMRVAAGKSVTIDVRRVTARVVA
jgi:hypothetical protein